jgi:putative transposase
MKEINNNLNIRKLCGLLGVSRQSYYQHNQQQQWLNVEQEMVIKRVKEIRQYHRFMGTRKLYELLQPFLLEHQIKIGRDALFDLLSEHKLLIRKRVRRIHTTQSYHMFHKWSNLIKNIELTEINQLWVSDITYWKVFSDTFLYISFITDAYSHKIIGYQIAETLQVVESVIALKRAILSSNWVGSNRPFQLIHHSDRGIQYCNPSYIRLIQENKIQISMTENGDPRENSIAERVNGIIKEEYLKTLRPTSLQQAKEMLENAIELYNNERPHLSLGMLTPNKIQLNPEIKPEKLWKNNYKKKYICVNQI